MRNPVISLWALLALAGPLAAQPAARHPDVPAAFDVAGLHLVLTEEAQRLVQQKADGLCRHQPSFQARVDLADAAFPLIDRVLQEEGVPLDFRYLALQESALQSDARSAHGAVGYWQLKHETASSLGLVVNEAVDERQHLVASTRAAARYLARNNARLRNWLDALLSYNTGLGGVQPYTLPTDAGATEMAITAGTAPYVLMFLAHKLAFEPVCGFNPHPPLRLRELPAVAGQTLETQALALHADLATLPAHNRWLLTPAVPADRPYTLIVPITDVAPAAGLAARLGRPSRGELLTTPAAAAPGTEVRVNNLRALVALPGETTMDLARRGGRRLGAFLHDNELTAFDTAVPGCLYYLESKRDAAAVEYHVAQPGETVADVAQKYGVRRKAVLAYNRLAPADELRPGRVLWLQHVRPREVAAEYRTPAEGAALERAAGRGSVIKPLRDGAPATAGAASAAPPRPRPAAPRPAAEARDGWGEALPAPGSAVAAASAEAPAVAPAKAAAPAPAPAPVRAAAPALAQLPPPAPAPAPAPLADEPRQPDPVEAPVVNPGPSPAAPMPTPSSGPARPAVPAPARPAAAPAAPVASAPAPASEATHRVEAHETVYSISRRYQLPPATLMALNHLTPPATLAVGQVLLLPVALPAASKSAPAPGVSRPAGGSANPALYAPQRAVSAATSVSPTATAAAQQHTVAAGETLYSIAKRYEVKVADLQAWNAKPDPAVKVGEVLRVQPVAK